HRGAGTDPGVGLRPRRVRLHLLPAEAQHAGDQLQHRQGRVGRAGPVDDGLGGGLMAGPFYFRWSDSTDHPWEPSYAVEDEDDYSFDLTHSAGDFPVLEVLIRNPKVGLLANSRQQWAWLSYQKPGEGSATPLFFGRILGVPQSIQNDLIRVTFVARPSDYEEQKEALAETLRVLPFFDPIW